MAAVDGLIRVFTREPLPRLHQALRRALPEPEDDEPPRILLYRHDRRPETLLSLLTQPEVAARYPGWLVRPIAPSAGGSGTLEVRPPIPKAPQGTSPQAYREAWQDGFRQWAQGRLAGFELDDEGDQEALLMRYGSQPEAEEDLDPQPEPGEPTTQPEDRELDWHEPADFWDADSQPLAVSASSTDDAPPFLRRCDGVFEVWAHEPNDERLYFELRWLETHSVPTLVELHPQDALPLLIRPQPAGQPSAPKPLEPATRWQLVHPADDFMQAMRLWQGLMADGQVHVHRRPVRS